MESKLKDVEAKWAAEFDILKNVEAETVAMLEQQKEALIKELELVTTFYQIIFYCIALYCILLYSIVFYCIVLHCIVFYCIALYCIVLYFIVLYCIVLYCIVLYCIVLYCIVLSCAMLYDKQLSTLFDLKYICDIENIRVR